MPNGHVATVANDVNDQRIRQKFLDEREIEQMQGRTLRPSLNALLVSDGLHENAEEIARIATLFENPRFDLLASQARTVEQIATQPVIE